ncbi:MAG: hypothetical protein ACREXU_23255, partial [Gammaproteobacteria bacterium]
KLLISWRRQRKRPNKRPEKRASDEDYQAITCRPKPKHAMVLRLDPFDLRRAVALALTLALMDVWRRRGWAHR